ncbi:hypothetical protein F0L46_18890 [Salinarimonas soli]|uniref:Uncharacterized protein n=1 Tax=Salinarimonas soli TaxID=1638099 RepID=A0A5B2V988_9HYPH|nr:hypothetical protein F0L46_18890 [Salinarimonas soli]
MTSTLNRAIAIAAEAHAGQVDKAGAPYILNPLRVMMRLTANDERIVKAPDHDSRFDPARPARAASHGQPCRRPCAVLHHGWGLLAPPPPRRVRRDRHGRPCTGAG